MGKLIKISIAGFALFLTAAVCRSMVAKYNAYLVNEAGLTYNKTYPLPLNSYGIDTISFTTIASSVTYLNTQFTDGQESTGTITVVSTTGLTAVSATNYMVIESTIIAFSSITITVNGYSINNAIIPFMDITTTATAINIKSQLAALVPNVSFSTGAGSQVYSTATAAGVYGNNMTMSVNCSTSVILVNSWTTALNGSNFTGGLNNSFVSINNSSITYTPQTTSSATALSIAAAINANSFLSSIITATAPTGGSVVYTTSTSVGLNTNYAIYSSSQGILQIGGSTVTVTGLGGAGQGQMWGGKDSAYTLISGSATVITSSSNFTLAVPVLYTTPSGVAITGLTTGTTYFVVPVTSSSFGLAKTSTDAVAGNFIVISSSKATTPQDNFLLTPLAIAGNLSFKWQVSNDAINWVDFNTTVNNITVSSITIGPTIYNSTGTLNNFDLGQLDYAFIRLNVVSPTAGGARLQVTGNGKNTYQ